MVVSMSDTLPLSLRLAKYKNTVFSSICAYFLLAIAITLILFRTSKVLRAYRKVFFMNSITDLMYTTSFFLFSPTMADVDDNYFVIMEGVAGSHPPRGVSFYLMWSCYYVGYLTVCITPIQYIFRMLLVCKDIELTKLQMFLLYIISNICAGTVSYLFLKQVYPTPDMYVKYDAYFNNSEWLWNGQTPSYGAATNTNMKKIAYLYVILFSGCYLIIAVCIACIVITMRKMTIPSGSVRRIQRQISFVLFLQALVPFMTIVVPVCLDVLTICNIIYIPQAGAVAVFVLVWSPTFNPLVTCLLVKHYRIEIRNALLLTLLFLIPKRAQKNNRVMDKFTTKIQFTVSQKFNDDDDEDS